jgi:hypothetical protein
MVPLSLLPDIPNRQHELTCTLDYEKVTGRALPWILTQEDVSSCVHYLFCGATLIQGSFIGLVVAMGTDTITSKLIQDGLWPPQHGEDLESWVDVQTRTDGSVQAQIRKYVPFSQYHRFLRRLGYPISTTCSIQQHTMEDENQALRSQDMEDPRLKDIV